MLSIVALGKCCYFDIDLIFRIARLLLSLKLAKLLLLPVIVRQLGIR